MMNSLIAKAGPSTGQRNHPYARSDEVKSTLSTSKINQNNSNKSNEQTNTVIDEGQKLIVGSVEKVARWCRMLTFMESTKIIYQVFGIMGLVKTGSYECEKIFCLRSQNTNSRIVCVFYEIDRKIPEVQRGSLVLCTGHVKGKNKLQIFTIRELHEDSSNSFDRISLVSQWTINDILLNKKK